MMPVRPVVASFLLLTLAAAPGRAAPAAGRALQEPCARYQVDGDTYPNADMGSGYLTPGRPCDYDDYPCFPSSALVVKADGARARMDALREGDVIVSATADGMLTTDVVSPLSIAMPREQATFVKLVTDANATLRLTPEHHLPIGDACCSRLKQAKDVRVGDTVHLLAAGGGGTAAVPAVVALVGAEIDQGRFSPVLTRGTFPVVDGVVTSFDSLEGVAVNTALHPFALPLLRAIGATNLARTLFFGEGISYIDRFEAASRAAVTRSPLASPAVAAAACATSA